MVYRACTEDYEYILKHVVNYDLVSKTDKFSEASMKLFRQFWLKLVVCVKRNYPHCASR